MEVRNVTPVRQHDSKTGIVLPPMPPDTWMDIPEETAFRLWRMRIVELREQQASEHLWKEPDGTHLFWMSPFSLADGYATAAEVLVTALARNGLKVHAASCWFASKNGLQQKTVEMLETALSGCKVGICMATAGEFKKLPTPYKIGFTMYESDNPLENMPEWRHDCSVVQELFVPSGYCREVFANFVKSPISVMPLAVSPFYCDPKPKKVRDRPWTFGIHGTLTGRKSPLELIECFQKAFPSERDVRLQVKTRLGWVGIDQDTIPHITDDRITIINDNWLPERVKGWMQKQIDVYVFPSKGEGYGMPPREAMACGVPTIVANNSGLSDMCNADYNWPIPTHHIEHSQLIGGNWSIPNWDALIETMRWTYEHREETYARGLRGARWMVDNFSDDAAAQRMISHINGIDPDAVPHGPPPEEETMELAVAGRHKEWYDILARKLPKDVTVIDFGFGEGVLYRWLVERGYQVVSVVEPSRVDEISRRLCALGLPVNLVSTHLLEASSAMTIRGNVLSQGVLQRYNVTEVPYLAREMVRLTSPDGACIFSVPTVNYDGQFGSGSLRRRDWWVDALLEFTLDPHYYGEHRAYLWAGILDFDAGSAGRAEVQARIRGRVMDGSWRPVARWQDGVATRKESA